MGPRVSRSRRRFIHILLFLLLGASGGCKQGPWTLWDTYAAHFIDPQGRVVDHHGAVDDDRHRRAAARPAPDLVRKKLHEHAHADT